MPDNDSKSILKPASRKVTMLGPTNADNTTAQLVTSIDPNPNQYMPVIDSKDSPILKLRHQVQTIVDIGK